MMVQPIYYDLVTHHIIVRDPQGIIAHIVDSTAAFLREVGARRVRRNNTWEWRANRFLGKVVAVVSVFPQRFTMRSFG